MASVLLVESEFAEIEATGCARLQVQMVGCSAPSPIRI